MDLKRMALERLHQDLVANKPLARYHYIKRNNDETCYCAVGHIMNTCGIDLSEMEEDSEVNGSCISGCYLADYFTKLTELGFTREELVTLQNMNDRMEYTEMRSYIEEKLV